MVTSYFANEIEFLVVHADHYAFHAPERTLFPSDLRNALATLSFVSNNLKKGIADKIQIADLCEALDHKIISWTAQVNQNYAEIEKGAIGDLAGFSSDMITLAELLEKSQYQENEAVDKARKIDAYVRHLRKSEMVQRFCSVSKEFPWLKDIILNDLKNIQKMLVDPESSVLEISEKLIKLTELLDKTSIDLADESRQFEDKTLQLRSDLIGAKERLNSIRIRLIGQPAMEDVG